jgi:hypothetical protein
MSPLDHANRSSRPRSRLVIAVALFVVSALAFMVACSDEAKDAVMSELAVGSWTCAPDAEGAENQPFTIHIEDDGTFRVPAEPGSVPNDVLPNDDEITGTWGIDDGDLEWGVDGQGGDRTVVEGFDALTLESPGFTLLQAGILEANDGSDDPVGEQDVLVDTHGTDSVTLRVPEGEPWTCDRQ